VTLVMALAFTNGLIYEVARKSKGREEEKPGELTFSQSWGVNQAALLMAGLMLLSFALFLTLGVSIIAMAWKDFVLTAAALLLTFWGIFKFRKTPTRKARQLVEGASALYVLAAYMAYICFVQLGI
jgi:hypothetical protein